MDKFIPKKPRQLLPAGTHHTFLFAGADPVNKSDPSGHDSITVLGLSGEQVVEAAEVGEAEELGFAFAGCAITAILTVNDINIWYADPNHSASTFPAWATANLALECGVGLGVNGLGLGKGVIPSWLLPVLKGGVEPAGCISAAGLFFNELSEWAEDPSQENLENATLGAFESTYSCIVVGANSN
jgi:hypothetical protein